MAISVFSPGLSPILGGLLLSQRVIVCNSAGYGKQFGVKFVRHVQITLNLPESSLTDQGFDAVFVEDDFAVEKIHINSLYLYSI